MEKLANLSFVLQCEDMDDRVKVAALESYVHSIDSLGSDEEKIAAFRDLEEMLKEAGWASMASWLAPKLTNWGARIGGAGKAGGMLSRFGNWIGGKGTNLANAASNVGKNTAAAVGTAAQSTARNARTYTKSQIQRMLELDRGRHLGNLGRSKLFNWAARHPGWAKAGIGAGMAGGIYAGGGLYGGMKANDAYKRGYGTAVGQLSPMVSALHAPQGAMTLPISHAPVRM